jgi:hypothetical protein
MKVRVGASTVIAAVAASLLMVLVVPAGIASATAADLAPGPAYTVWAYGAVRTVDFSGVTVRGWEYEGTATYGYTVILNQTNLTAQTFELTANRTMGSRLSVEYCAPTCKHPTSVATISYVAWEAIDAWANFTTNGSVLENGASVPAIALLNSHTTVNGNLTDRLASPMRSGYLTSSVTAAASVTFAQPLGLIPDNLTAGASWTSSSAFAAAGSYTLDYFYHFHGPLLNETVGPSATGGYVNRSGNVSVAGSVRPGSVPLDGTPYQNLSLSVQGPFDAREGFLLVPSVVDLFGASPPGPTDMQSGATAAQMTSIYVRPGGAHLGIGGSEWVYRASALNPFTAPTPVGGGSITELAAGADNVSSTPVQGVPIAVAQATQDQNCLVSGAGCSAPAKTLGALFGIGAAVVVVAVLALAAVVVTQRRRVPPPSYPNAQLYPPGAPIGDARRSSSAGTPPSPPPEEEDPLSNLW